MLKFELDDFDLGFDLNPDPVPEFQNKNDTHKDINKDIKATCISRKEKNIYRRAFSETKLLEILDYNFDIEKTYHCITNGDIDALSFLKHLIRKQDLKYLLFSTWCMALDDVLQLKEWVENGKIKKMDAYCGEIFPGTYSTEFEALKKAIREIGRVCIFRNHSKVFVGKGKKFSFAIESSANINTNPRMEQTVVTFGDDIFYFYKDFFDRIKSFDHSFDGWIKWQEKQN